jgi:hypothetical protein
LKPSHLIADKTQASSAKIASRVKLPSQSSLSSHEFQKIMDMTGRYKETTQRVRPKRLHGKRPELS